tara:strand:+ start:1922 stop:2785 length:864 start_codon:yes stop_codon:yes gene_type:complete
MSLFDGNYKILLIGKGKWGKTMTKLMINFGFSVFYVSRKNERDLYFEEYINSDKLTFFDKENKDFHQFDIVYISVGYLQTYNVWKEFKENSDKFLIEKPGSLNPNILSQILFEAKLEKKYVLFNYEFYFEKNSLYLRNILKETTEKISKIEIFWQKNINVPDGLNWRLLPHMFAELFYSINNEIVIDQYEIKKNDAFFKGKINKNINFDIVIKNNEKLVHYSKFVMFNGDIFFKDRIFLKLKNNIICKNNISSIENIFRLLIAGDLKLENQNHSLALNVANIISNLK